MRVALAVLFLVSLGSSATEHKWEALPGKSNDGTVIYIDRTSVNHERQKDAHLVGAWFKARNPKLKYDSWVQLAIFDCVIRAYAPLSNIRYDSRGRVLSNETVKGVPPMNPVAPDTVGEAMLDGACVEPK